jgi:hypothetical protein
MSTFNVDLSGVVAVVGGRTLAWKNSLGRVSDP